MTSRPSLQDQLEELQIQLNGMNINGQDNVTRQLLILSLSALEDNLKKEQLLEVIVVNNLDGRSCESIILSFAEILWDLTKDISGNIVNLFERYNGDQSIQANELLQLVLNFYRENVTRLLTLQDSFGITAPRYENLSWRLDIEYSRRSMSQVMEPVFQIRLDTSSESRHLQGDYRTMKLICSELQKAVDEFENVHCQRLMHYL